jgi:catechol 2,3-dioxygenase-like lactoylglutathione lyase family enzyme
VEPRLLSGTAHPGAVHVCLAVREIDQAWVHALACGGSKVGEGPVEIPSGPHKGARHVYVRDPNGVTIELRQQPPAPAR